MLVQTTALDFVDDHEVHAVFERLQCRAYRLLSVGGLTLKSSGWIDFTGLGPLLDGPRREYAVDPPGLLSLIEQPYLIPDDMLDQVAEKEVAVVAQPVRRGHIEVGQ